MKSKTRNILIILGFVLLIFTSLIGYGFYSIFSLFSSFGSYRNMPIPAEIQQARILKGENFLEKKEFFKITETSKWETIKKAATEKDEKQKQKQISSDVAKEIYGFADIKMCGDEIVAVGEFGGYVFNKNGELKREIFFEPDVRKIKIFGYEHITYRDTLDNLKIVDLENDGRCEFVSFGSTDGLAVFNSKGDATWRFGKREIDVWKEQTKEEEKEVYITNVAVVDLDDDGISEFIISRKGEGIKAFDINKKEIWFQPDDFPTSNFEVVDLDGDGSEELFEFQGMSSTVRDKKTGEVIKKVEIDGWSKQILKDSGNQKNIGVRFFDIDENKLMVSDIENKTIFNAVAPLSEIKIEPEKIDFPTPSPIYVGNENVRAEPMGDSFVRDSEGIYEPKAIWVNLQKDKPKYLAIVGSFISIPRANFYLYDSDGNLVYHELLPEAAETLAVLPTDNEVEEILIGGKDTIWKFAVK